ncbi:MAG TPA: ABC transporter ATP-binding protein [Planctomycetota bacterium]|nr:ABC transporter ATP-binding protein [Planctomycetota bacterium]
MDPLLRCEDLSVGYGRRAVASGLAFSVPRGTAFHIVGPNGCGKTTLLKTIVGIVSPLAGRVAWSGAPASARPTIGYVPQRDSIDSIYPFRALEVVRLGLGADRLFRPTLPRALADRARSALERVGLGHRVGAGYSELSGGERQRVLVARALALEPELLALDEPTSELDPGSAERLLDLIESLRRDAKLTVLLVSHDLSGVARRATHVLAMNDGRYVVGPVGETLTSERLTALYGYPMAVVRENGRVAVVPAGEA